MRSENEHMKLIVTFEVLKSLCFLYILLRTCYNSIQEGDTVMSKEITYPDDDFKSIIEIINTAR